MSNPAVISLASLSDVNFPYRFEVEDNIGEAIHIHYKELRFDLTIKEFYQLADEIEAILGKLLDVEGFHYKDFDEVALINMSNRLTDIEKALNDTIYLEDILVDTYNQNGNRIYDSLKNSRVLKALNGLPSENDNHFEINYYKADSAQKMSNGERLIYVLNQIKTKGYPINQERITLFGDSNIILDGQHRAACLYYLYGNIKVPVKRLFLRENVANTAANQTSITEYENRTLKKVHLLPFEFIPKNSKIIMYGAGNVCKEFLDQIEELKWCEVLFLIDKNYRNIEKDIMPIFGLDILDWDIKYDYILIAIDCKEIVQEVEKALIKKGVDKQKIVSMWDRP